MSQDLHPVSGLRFPFGKRSGFTLVEMIIVIVITAIVAAAVALFIRLPVQGYVDLAARADLVDEADTAIRRMSRDLRLALPNSIRTNIAANGNQYLELLLTKTGARYLDSSDGIAGGSLRILDFSNSSATQFTMIGANPSQASQQIQANSTANQGDYVVVYNLGPGQDPANAYCSGDTCGNRAKIIAFTYPAITLQSNPFAGQTVLQSPSHRFQIVSTPVTYECNPTTGNLTRYSGYPIQVNVPSAAPAGATVTGILATGVTGCSFDYTVLANVRNSMVGIRLAMQRSNTNSGVITLFHQAHVDNTP
jgi:MSHA biogenesis protein MshO